MPGLFVVLLTTVLLVAACGSGSEESSSDDTEFVDLLKEDLVAEDDPNALYFEPDEADCVAVRTVTGLGTVRLIELGYDPESGSSPGQPPPGLTENERATVAEILSECVDLASKVATLLQDSGGIDLEAATCAAEAYVSTLEFRDALTLAEPDEATLGRIDAALSDAVQTCGA